MLTVGRGMASTGPGVTRRDFLRVGGLGALGLTMAEGGVLEVAGTVHAASAGARRASPASADTSMESDAASTVGRATMRTRRIPGPGSARGTIVGAFKPGTTARIAGSASSGAFIMRYL